MATRRAVVLVDAVTQEVQGSCETQGEVFSSPVLWWDDQLQSLQLAVGCRDNHLYCFSLKKLEVELGFLGHG